MYYLNEQLHRKVGEMGEDKLGVKPSRIAILSAIRTPLTLFALIFLIIEAILLVVAQKASGLNLSLLIVGMIVTFIMLLTIVLYISMKRPELLHAESEGLVPSPRVSYDVFLSSPMAAFSDDEEYKHDRKGVLSIVDTLQDKCKFNAIFYAGRYIDSVDNFDAEDISIQTDYKALSESSYFVMLYPKKIVSSVLVEAGWALALRKPSIYFVHDRDDLPFLLKEAAMAYPRVKVYEEDNIDDIVKLIEQNGEEIFRILSPERQSSV